MELIRIIQNIQDSVGTLFNEENADAFKLHIKEISGLEDKLIAKRIATLFANWSNINYFLGDHFEADSDNFSQALLLKEYKFSIVCELAKLCPIILASASGKIMKMHALADFEVFQNTLASADDISREHKVNDFDAYVGLMMLLEEKCTYPSNNSLSE